MNFAHILHQLVSLEINRIYQSIIMPKERIGLNVGFILLKFNHPESIKAFTLCLKHKHFLVE